MLHDSYAMHENKIIRVTILYRALTLRSIYLHDSISTSYLTGYKLRYKSKFNVAIMVNQCIKIMEDTQCRLSGRI